MSICRVCSCELNDENWANSLKKRNSCICKSCHLEIGRKWRKENREKSNQYSINAYKRNPQKCKIITVRSRFKTRIDAINAYGAKCCSCGIDDFDVLDIDHIFNDGAAERKKNLFAYNLYRELKKQGYPKDRYQILCKNCNWKKEIQRRRSSSFTNI
jgi:hypothetical protein